MGVHSSDWMSPSTSPGRSTRRTPWYEPLGSVSRAGRPSGRSRHRCWVCGTRRRSRRAVAVACPGWRPARICLICPVGRRSGPHVLSDPHRLLDEPRIAGCVLPLRLGHHRVLAWLMVAVSGVPTGRPRSPELSCRRQSEVVSGRAGRCASCRPGGRAGPVRATAGPCAAALPPAGGGVRVSRSPGREAVAAALFRLSWKADTEERAGAGTWSSVPTRRTRLSRVWRYRGSSPYRIQDPGPPCP